MKCILNVKDLDIDGRKSLSLIFIVVPRWKVGKMEGGGIEIYLPVLFSVVFSFYIIKILNY